VRNTFVIESARDCYQPLNGERVGNRVRAIRVYYVRSNRAIEPSSLPGIVIGLSMVEGKETGVGAIRYERYLKYCAIESAGIEAGVSMVRMRMT
jgi:hypothetical protein